jgi:hypothetical protein
LDEEIEHMQWQLNKRSNNTGGNGQHGSRADNGGRNSKATKQHVFHYRRENNSNHRRQGKKAIDAASTSAPLQPIDVASQLLTETSPASGLAAHYHLQLQHCYSRADLQKARDRLSKHVRHEKGCCVSFTPAQSAL